MFVKKLFNGNTYSQFAVSTCAFCSWSFSQRLFSDGEQQLLSIGGRSYGKSRRVMLSGGLLVCPSSIYSSQKAIRLIENTFYI